MIKPTIVYSLILVLIVFPLAIFGQSKKMVRKALKLSDPKKQITLFTEATKIDNKNLEAYFHRGIAKAKTKDHTGAILDFTKVIFFKPDAISYYNRGYSKYNIQDYIGAKDDFIEAIKLEPHFTEAIYSLALVQYDLTKYKSALENLNKIIKTKFFDIKFANINLRSTVQYMQKDSYKLLNYYDNNPNKLEDVIENYYENNAYILKALAYEGLGEYKNAFLNYSYNIIRTPNSENYYLRGAFLTKIKLYREANIDLTISLKMSKKNPHAFFYRGASNLHLGNHNNAIADFLEAIKFDAMDFDSYLGLAMAYNKVNDTNNAKLNFKRANQILSIHKNVKTIEQYNSSYWFKNNYYFFTNNITQVVRLK